MSVPSLSWQMMSQKGKLHAANCIMTAPNLHFSYCFQGKFCKSPLLRVIFNRKLGNCYAIRSNMWVHAPPRWELSP